MKQLFFSAWWTSSWQEYTHYHISRPFSIQCQTAPVPIPREKRKQPSAEENGNSEEDEIIDPDYRGAAEKRNPYYFNQKDLVRGLCLTKSDAELLMSRLKQCNMLHENVAGQKRRHRCVCQAFSLVKIDFASATI